MAAPVVTRDRAAHRAVVRPIGELDLSTAVGLAAGLDEACGSGLDVVVDLSAVDFVDAHTLGLLLATSQRLADGGCPLSIVGASPWVRRVFELTGLDKLLEPPPTTGHQIEIRG
jgi:anti-anti-sigma factor